MSKPLIENGWVYLGCVRPECHRVFRVLAGIRRAFQPRYCCDACYQRARQHPRSRRPTAQRPQWSPDTPRGHWQRPR